LAKLPILIDDSAGENIVDIQSKLKQLNKNQKYNIKLVVIDYLQLLHGPRTKGVQLNRQQEVSIISRMLKLLARELKVPIVALAQLSLAAEGSIVPQLSHLRESGSLEQDADLVCFLHKQDDNANKLNDQNDYQIKNQDFDTKLSNANNFKRITFIIAKHRNGITKDIPMFLDNCGVFQEL
jgi:replicative DNA helicase